MSDARSILQDHYRDASRLDARIQLHAQYSTNTQGLHTWVFEHLRLPPTCRVLEVGCGSGQLWLRPANTTLPLIAASRGDSVATWRFLLHCSVQDEEVASTGGAKR